MWRSRRRGSEGSLSYCWVNRRGRCPGWLSNLFGKGKRDDSQTDDLDENPQSAITNPQYDDPDDAPVSTLAMMSEKSPEAWLGQFLTILGAPPALQYSTIKAAKEDNKLAAHLKSVLDAAGKDQPMRLLEPGYAETLKAKDWAAWWRASEALGRYCYAIMSLTMLGDQSHNADLIAMYRQDANSRIQKHAALRHLLHTWQGLARLPGDRERSITPLASPMIGRSTVPTDQYPLVRNLSRAACKEMGA